MTQPPTQPMAGGPSQPPAAPPPHQPPAGAPPGGGQPPQQPPAGPAQPWGGPPRPPRGPGWFRQATSTTGGVVALVVAGCLALVLLVGVVGVAALVGVRLIGSHHESVAVRMMQPGAPLNQLPPGQRKLLQRGQGAPGLGMRGMRGGQVPGLGSGLGTLQHGEFTVRRADGTDVAMTVQRGSVTAVSGSSITVRSADGFTGTYAIDSSTRGQGVKAVTGDTVLVVAQKDGAKAVLVRVARAG